jgi:hypothetical protein
MRRVRWVSRDMPGWDTLETVTALHGGLQLAGLILLLMLGALAGFVAYQLRTRAWPEWLDIGEYQLRSRFIEIGCALVLALLLICQGTAYSYGVRQKTLTDTAEQASADRIRHLVAEAKTHPASDGSGSRYFKENSDLRQKLNDAETRLADLEKAQTQKRLSSDQKRFLIEILRPFAGQKVSIASISGDAEGLELVKDFVSVFEAAGWDHHGDAGISTQEWPRDPVGVEVTLNETDARANHIPEGAAALINATRQLGLVYDSTIYMDNDVPSGQALLKVGKKLRK